MKIFNIFFLLIILTFLNAIEKSQLARLHYDGGGDWYNDSDILPNLAQYLNKTIQTDFALEQAIVKPADSKIFEFPFVFMTGHGNITFSEKDAENLRKYLLQGGFLLADDDYGMDASFRREIQKVFPEKELIELPANHEIFHSFFSFEKGLTKTHKHDEKRAQAFAIFDDFGRMMVLYIFESNISDGWSDVHDDPENIKELAFQMGANIFYYLITK